MEIGGSIYLILPHAELVIAELLFDPSSLTYLHPTYNTTTIKSRALERKFAVPQYIAEPLLLSNFWGVQAPYPRNSPYGYAHDTVASIIV